MSMTARLGDALTSALLEGDADRIRQTVDTLLSLGASYTHPIERWMRAQEAARLLGSHAETLFSRYPDVVGDYLRGNKLCIELSRFQVPLSCFRNEDVLVMATNRSPVARQDSADPLRSLWETEGKLDTSRDARQVEAASYFVCMDGFVSWGPKDVLSGLVMRNASSEAFLCPVIKALVQWHWRTIWKMRFTISLVLHLISCVFFTIFAMMSAHMESHEDENACPGRLGALGASIAFSYFLAHMGTMHPLRLLSFASRWVMLFLILFSPDSMELIASLTALECVFSWGSTMWYLQPYKHTGPLISMIVFVLRDIAIFVALTLIIMIGFGAAFVVLFSPALIEDEDKLFINLPRSLATLFYALLGDIHPSAFRAEGDGLFWLRTSLFNFYLFCGPVMLLSLLISILGDTFDRVKLKEEFEHVRCRARVICGRYCASWLHWFGWPRFRHGGYVSFKDGWLGVVAVAVGLSYLICWLILDEERVMFKILYVAEVALFLVAVFTVATWVRKRILQSQQRHEASGGRYFHILVPIDPIGVIQDSAWNGKLRAMEDMIKRAVTTCERTNLRNRNAIQDDAHDLRNTVGRMTEEMTVLQDEMANIRLSLQRIQRTIERNR